MEDVIYIPDVKILPADLHLAVSTRKLISFRWILASRIQSQYCTSRITREYIQFREYISLLFAFCNVNAQARIRLVHRVDTREGCGATRYISLYVCNMKHLAPIIPAEQYGFTYTTFRRYMLTSHCSHTHIVRAHANIRVDREKGGCGGGGEGAGGGGGEGTISRIKLRERPPRIRLTINSLDFRR